MKISTSTALAVVLGLSEAYVPIPQQANSGSPPQRKDIDTLSQAERDLFILAMQEYVKAGASSVSGFYQVAGIHGAPFQYWDNDGGYGTTSTGNKKTGYCFHSEQNFYLWHRPYMSLVEEQMRAFALNISANWYSPQRATYQAAAASLRHPYWDWAKSSSVPSILGDTQVTVTSPTTGQQVSIKNPLQSYTLPSDGNLGTYSNGQAVQIGSGRSTVRGSTYQRDLTNAGASLKRNTALLLNTANVCWNVFATTNTNQQSQCGGTKNIQSLESIHNTVHGTISGTMNNLATSAFDPIFWLHHANVDRIGAIWQAINPNTKIQNTQATTSTFVAGPGTRGESFQYLPFRSGNGNTQWWQAGQLYDVRSTGYTYPEIYDQPSAAVALQRAQALYGTGRTQSALTASSAKVKREEITAARAYRRAAAAGNVQLSEPPSTAALQPYKSVLIRPDGSYHEYTIALTIKKSVALGTSFTLHLFFGDVSGTDYLDANNRVGGFAVAQAVGATNEDQVNGAVPITDPLLNTLVAGKVKDFEPDTIRKYVHSKLVWRLVTDDGKDISNKAKDNGLQIDVQHSIVTPDGPTGGMNRPLIADPERIADTTDNTVAKPLESGVAAATASSS